MRISERMARNLGIDDARLDAKIDAPSLRLG